MKIGNVVYENELVNHVKSDYINYYNESMSYDKLDNSLPTLYVGWMFMKKCNPDNSIIQNADILKNKIVSNELYWEFGFSENKASHVKGVNNFTGLAPQFYFKPKYNYINLDPVFFQLKDIQDIVDVIPKTIDKYYLLKNSMIYLLSGNKIYGLNFDMYRFFKFDIDELMFKLEELIFDNNSEQNKCVNDIDGLIYEKYYKIFPNFELLKRYIVTII